MQRLVLPASQINFHWINKIYFITHQIFTDKSSFLCFIINSWNSKQIRENVLLSLTFLLDSRNKICKAYCAPNTVSLRVLSCGDLCLALHKYVCKRDYMLAYKVKMVVRVIGLFDYCPKNNKIMSITHAWIFQNKKF